MKYKNKIAILLLSISIISSSFGEQPKIPENKKLTQAISSLSSKSYQVRKKAVLYLSNLPPKCEEAIPKLTPLLQRPQLGSTIAVILAKYKEKALPWLKKELKNKNSTARENAIFALEWMGEKAKPVTPSLMLLLKDPSLKVQIAVLKALSEIGRRENDNIISILITKLKKCKNWNVEKAVVSTLSKIGNKEEDKIAKAFLFRVRILLNKDKGKQKKLEFYNAALIRLGRKTVPTLMNNLSDGNFQMKNFITGCLLGMGKSSEPYLTKLVNHKEWEIRFYAAYILGLNRNILSKSSLLRKGINHKDEHIRVCTIEYFAQRHLTHLSEPAAIPICFQGLKDKSARVRTRSIYFLGLIGERQYSFRIEEKLLSLLKDRSSAVREHAISALYKMGIKTNRAENIIFSALKNNKQSKEFKSYAISLLGSRKIRNKGIASFLFNMLAKEGEKELELVILNSLSNLYPQLSEKYQKKLVNILIDKLKTKNVKVKLKLINSLKLIGNDAEQALPYLKRLLKERNFFIRKAAKNALEELGDKDSKNIKK